MRKISFSFFDLLKAVLLIWCGILTHFWSLYGYIKVNEIFRHWSVKQCFSFSFKISYNSSFTRLDVFQVSFLSVSLKIKSKRLLLQIFFADKICDTIEKIKLFCPEVKSSKMHVSLGQIPTEIFMYIKNSEYTYIQIDIHVHTLFI